MQEPQIRYARTTDGVGIAWYAIGQGLPFVWPSSLLGNISDGWRVPELRAVLEGIASRALLVCFDPRGTGLSDRESPELSVEAMVRDTEAVVEAAGIDNITLSVWGYYSVPALAYAASHPDRVMALLLFNGIIRGSDMSPSWKSLMRLAREDWDLAKRLFAQTNEAGYAQTLTLDQVRRILDRNLTQEGFLRAYEAIDNWDASGFVDKVSVPALVLHYGEHAPNYPLESCRRLAASLPNATFSSLTPDSGETVYEAAGKAVRRFLRDVVPAEARPRRAAAHAGTSSGTAVILFADIVDSTALTERLGDSAFREKARELDTAMRSIIREHSGTAIEGKLVGDGVLAVFISARQAIEAALACANASGELALHLGIHAGDVIREADNVYGGAVNIAARISALSAPGEVLVSDTVRSLGRTSAGVSFVDRGEQALKGIAEPVRVWAVV